MIVVSMENSQMLIEKSFKNKHTFLFTINNIIYYK